MHVLSADHVDLAYDSTVVVQDLSLEVPQGQVTTIIGPNGCGKSTLLRALVRLLKPKTGQVVLDGQLIHSLPGKEVARRLGLLAQQSTAPEGVTVEDLTRRGRFPHQSFLQPPSPKDQEAVERALALTGMTALRNRPIDGLSGGQRQRAWIAMAIAQETPLLLLDEPTTYLDVAHQLEIVDLVRRLNKEENRTIVMVLHDINQAAIASDHLIAMKDGVIQWQGSPAEMLTSERLGDLYGTRCDVVHDPETGRPHCMPVSRVWRDNPPAPRHRSTIRIEGVSTGYEKSTISRDLSLELPGGSVTAIVGPNACGKSTLLRTVARLQSAKDGELHLDDLDLRRCSQRRLARQLAMLTQGAITPAGLRVDELVALGRYPHQGIFRQWCDRDEKVTWDAVCDCQLAELHARPVETLSGGQRQRAWFAMSLVQETPVLFLDEPTTFLDINAQLEMLDMIWKLNRVDGRTVVMVLHDLNMAARYADHLIAMRDGEIIAAGHPSDVITHAMLRDVFSIEATIEPDKRTGRPLVLPRTWLSSPGESRGAMQAETMDLAAE
ncbi:MAG TPA: ABC transporter ATP-binding protein [Thermomicrobiales bacterium]|jgi:iron complex transport system ATP-binding protein|nr:ABC transporter ATP-binding protein [Thermomicrobiales bacterium]